MLQFSPRGYFSKWEYTPFIPQRDCNPLKGPAKEGIPYSRKPPTYSYSIWMNARVDFDPSWPGCEIVRTQGASCKSPFMAKIFVGSQEQGFWAISGPDASRAGPPKLTDEEMESVDDQSRSFEIERLEGMGVLKRLQPEEVAVVALSVRGVTLPVWRVASSESPGWRMPGVARRVFTKLTSRAVTAICGRGAMTRMASARLQKTARCSGNSLCTPQSFVFCTHAVRFRQCF